MEKFISAALKFSNAFLLFIIFKIIFDWLSAGSGRLANFFDSYSDILTEVFFYALAWTLITTKFRNKRQSPRNGLSRDESAISG